MTRLVVVGGGAAGMSAASVAKRRDPELEVVVLEQGGFISFSACGMPYWLGGIVEGEVDRLVVLTPEDARERGLDVRMRTRALDVDPDARTLTIQGPKEPSEPEAPNEPEQLAYDHLVLAPGVRAREPWPGCELDGVHSLRHLDDGAGMMDDLEAHAPTRAVVVGGGFVGVEVADGLAHRGIETALVHSGSALLDALVEPELGELVNEQVREAGVELHLGTRAQGLAGDGQGRVAGVDTGDQVLEADLVVVAIGAVPRNELAEAVGCELGPAGTVLVDDRMATSVPGVWACGDCVAFEHKLTGEPTFLPLALHANRAGRVVGENVAGGQARFPGVLGTAITTFQDLEIAATGLTLPAAREAGFEATAETITSVTRAGYFPGASDVHVRTVVEERTGRLLGGQIVGGPGAGKRIDTIAAAVWMGATAQDVESMDLAYAPPVSPTWDPVAIGARLAGRQAHR